ncbi:MAG: hypothetical protein JEZ06_02605 [Anaerolineaceae bacterium]|nr:hypothetical protein [Anaerolineaceae bacterium]
MSDLENLIQAVCKSSRYDQIDRGLIAWIGKEELRKRKSLKEAVKSTRSRLHQAAGAYREKKINFPALEKEMMELEPSLQNEGLKAFCREAMQTHASTQERLPILESFFDQILAEIQPVGSILDIACGLNPLTLPWIPVSGNIEYFACDIYTDMINFLNNFFSFTLVSGEAKLCDITQHIPQQPVQLALLLKAIPCLEHLDKQIAYRLLDSLKAEHILISYPVQSLGGHSKGMIQHYDNQFEDIISGKSWKIQRFEFSTELAFLISR